jgi:hypothetical protein
MLTTSNFTFLKASVVAADPEIVPDEPGVYALLVPRSDLADAFVDEIVNCESRSTVFPDHLVLYVGASGETIRRRLKSHVLGDSYASTMRMGIGVLLEKQLGLTPTVMPGRCYFRFSPETPLTEWITAHVTTSYHLCDRPYPYEEELIREDTSLLNIVGRPASDFSRRLMALRARYNGRRSS